ncbi:MAG: peptidoglycan editing factor PgeF [Proteobacteria bacterium]|nr:peptidoglycan editing factor PgeF [Pseudomonadota bacterium]MCP4921926.1 peptidoglycan editing factor PgeF [Pseudomonadota bacterium]
MDVLRLSQGLAELPHVRHGFTTRKGGVSMGSLATLNLARRPGETDEALVENWRRAVDAVGLSGAPVAIVNQVHGHAVADGDAPRGPLDPLADADAVVVTKPGVVAAIRVADCVPVLLAAPGGVAAVHAGWRGTVERIVPIAVQVLCARTRCRPSDVVAAVGPCISVEAYEVGDEVLDRVSALGPGLTRGRHADLKAANALLLRECGVEQVDVLAGCTSGDPAFFSHRRDRGDTGRQAALIGLVP